MASPERFLHRSASDSFSTPIPRPSRDLVHLRAVEERSQASVRTQQDSEKAEAKRKKKQRDEAFMANGNSLSKYARILLSAGVENVTP